MPEVTGILAHDSEFVHPHPPHKWRVTDYPTPLDDLFLSYVGREVEVRLELQPHPFGKWGRGSCLWQSFGTCPLGHHEDPEAMPVFEAKGVLTFSEKRLCIGARTAPLWSYRGHRVGLSLMDRVERLLHKAADIRSRLVDVKNAWEDM